MTAGPRDAQLFQDVCFLEKLGHFDREVIPERSVGGGQAPAHRQLRQARFGSWLGCSVGNGTGCLNEIV